MTGDCLTAALLYAEQGHPIIPLDGKRPMIKWAADASTDPKTIERWWRGMPHANVGVRCDHLLVVDIDPRPGRDALATWRELAEPHGWAEGQTHTVRTPSGGLHIYYALPQGLDIRNSVNKLGDGIDIRAGAGGYVVAPPSPGYEVVS